jgi:two-component system phosphate regulon response regulator PhoB
MAKARTVLVVDDERDLLELVAYNLKRAGYDVLTAQNGRRGLDTISESKPDLVILDVMLPELSGTEVASRVRANPLTASIPIIMLTAKGGETDQVVGLAVGADDYIAKPFSMKILLARVEALLRRAGRASAEHTSLELGTIRLDLETHEAFVSNEPVKLTLTEFRILAALLQAQGRVLSRAALMSRAMGPGVLVTERTIDVHVTSIRKKLEDQADLIKTVRGVGYRMTPDPTSAADQESGRP